MCRPLICILQVHDVSRNRKLVDSSPFKWPCKLHPPSCTHCTHCTPCHRPGNFGPTFAPVPIDLHTVDPPPLPDSATSPRRQDPPGGARSLLKSRSNGGLGIAGGNSIPCDSRGEESQFLSNLLIPRQDLKEVWLKIPVPSSITSPASMNQRCTGSSIIAIWYMIYQPNTGPSIFPDHHGGYFYKRKKK